MSEYIYLICPFITLIVCQIIKFSIESALTHQFCWDRLFNGCGGMPSSHTSFSFSLTFLIGYTIGFETPIFAVALIFSFIVAYDAMGLRMESGKQAEAINQIVKGIMTKKNSLQIQQLKEELGHKPLEVLVGILLAAVMSTIFYVSL